MYRGGDNVKTIDTLDNVFMVFGFTLGITQIKEWMGMLLIAFQLILLLIKLIYKIYKSFKKGNVIETITDVMDEVDDVIDEVTSDEREREK